MTTADRRRYNIYFIFMIFERQELVHPYRHCNRLGFIICFCPLYNYMLRDKTIMLYLTTCCCLPDRKETFFSSFAEQVIRLLGMRTVTEKCPNRKRQVVEIYIFYSVFPRRHIRFESNSSCCFKTT